MTCVGERRPRVRRVLALFFDFGFFANIFPPSRFVLAVCCETCCHTTAQPDRVKALPVLADMVYNVYRCRFPPKLNTVFPFCFFI